MRVEDGGKFVIYTSLKKILIIYSKKKHILDDEHTLWELRIIQDTIGPKKIYNYYPFV